MQALDGLLEMAPWFIDYVDAARGELQSVQQVQRVLNAEVRYVRGKNEELARVNANLQTVNQAFTLKLGRAGALYEHKIDALNAEIRKLVTLVGELRCKEELMQRTIQIFVGIMTPEQRAELKFKTAESLTLERRSAPGQRSI